MINQIIPLGEKNRKVLAFTDQQIIFSSRSHDTIDSLLESSQKSSLLETIKVIPMESVKELHLNEREELFTLRYEKKGKLKSTTVVLANSSIQQQLLSEIAEVRGLTMGVGTEAKRNVLLKNLLPVVLILILIILAIVAPNDGEESVSSGRGKRKVASEIFSTLTDTLGPNGMLILGVLGLAYFSFKAYKRYQKPASEITFK